MTGPIEHERVAQQVPFVLVEAPGRVTPGHDVEDHDLLRAVQELLA